MASLSCSHPASTMVSRAGIKRQLPSSTSWQKASFTTPASSTGPKGRKRYCKEHAVPADGNVVVRARAPQISRSLSTSARRTTEVERVRSQHPDSPNAGLPSQAVDLDSNVPSGVKLAPHIQLKRLLGDLRALLEEATGADAAGKGRQIAYSARNGGNEEEKQWLERLRSTAEDLRVNAKRRSRIAILADSHYKAAELSLALLDDPLSADQMPYEALRRLRDQKATPKLAYSERPEMTDDSVSLSLPWLRDSHCEIEEVIHSDSSTPLRPSAWTTLLSADIVLVLALPTGRGDVARLSQKPNVVHLCESCKFPRDPRMFAPLDGKTTSTSSTASSLQRMTLDTELALQANGLLRSTEPFSGPAHQKMADFSSLLLTSGVPQLREYLSSLCAAEQSGIDASDHMHPMHLNTAKHVASAFLVSFTSALAEARSFLHDASSEVGQLSLHSARDKRHSQIELGFTDMGNMDLAELVNDHPTAPEKGKKTQVAAPDVPGEGAKETVLLEDGKRQVEAVLEGKKSRIQWWKLPFGRADDISPELGHALTGYFGDLEKKLIFETGRLSERSLALSLAVDKLFKPPGPFAQRSADSLSLYSAIMQNTLLSLSPTTQFGFPPPSHPSSMNLRQTSISQPITDRKKQLLAAGGPIDRLQRRAQSAVVRFYGIFCGTGALAAFMSQTPLQEVSVDMSTAVGIAMLGGVTALWRLQGKWKTAKKGFWEDWKRAQEGLSYDLQTNADNILERKVFVKADTARHLLQEQLRERSSTLEQLERALRRHAGDLKAAGSSR